MQELSPKYDPKEVEERWYKIWEERGYFNAQPASGKTPFSIVIPPPNVTGSLHIGHALNNTLQDLLARWKRMRGFDVLWVPGCDHGGIATHNVVERELAKEGLKREAMGRDAFLKRVWQWKEESGGTIMRQLRRLGSSCDWRYERFTMDEGLSAAVTEAFVRLYDKGLIYQGDYIINWCPRCGTALSDIETEHKETDGKLYHIRYPVQGRPGRFVVVATTRPETLPGDVAVAAHPEDPRYAGLKGSKLLLPLFGRELPLLFDAYVDKDFGTGALKITPAHDANDFEIGGRYGLERIKVMDPKGVMNASAGKYAGMDRFECRKAIVADLQAAGLVERIEDYHHAVARCSRCSTVVESILSLQWFVRMKPMAEMALAAVERGDTVFQPASWSKVYCDWLSGIRDWCISRQIWWGHRIPVYRAPDGRQTAARSPKEAAARLKVEEASLEQEEDVLDTWFSSGLWPFSTLGWPDKTPDMDRYFPTSVLVTGWDILFFWVARMSMFSLELTGLVPFKAVLINSLVADGHGQKMSKSKGNVVDPLLKIDSIGADALRLGLCTIESQSRYISLSEERLETARNFTNKVWNAARFMLMHLQGLPAGAPRRPSAGLELADRWILARLDLATAETSRFLEEGVQVNQASECLTHFFWDDLCDWYIEAVKARLTGDDAGSRSTAQRTLAFVLEQTLRLLHPFCPFMTEEIWQLLPHEGETISRASWPSSPPAPDAAALEDFGQVMEVVRVVRNLRAEMKVDLKREVRVLLSAPPKVQALLASQSGLMQSLARMQAEELAEGAAPPKGAMAQLAGTVQVFLPLEGLLDLGLERQRLEKERGRLQGLLAAQKAKLGNESFVSKAPAAVVAVERAKVVEFEGALEKLEKSLKELGA
ncbi:MAG TPA: valine--tRNA ligase [bacterium]|jgi:valyl-tRNA synthetase|nr:valine--tRNA ligase [bacterium]